MKSIFTVCVLLLISLVIFDCFSFIPLLLDFLKVVQYLHVTVLLPFAGLSAYNNFLYN